MAPNTEDSHVFKSIILRAIKMGQQAKMLSAKPDNLSLVPGIYLVGENQLTQVSRAVA